MIELTLEQAQSLVDVLKDGEGTLSPDQLSAVTALVAKVADVRGRWAPKPGPRFTVWETCEGGSFFIRDTVEGKRFNNESFAKESAAQEYADDLNKWFPVG